MESLALVLISTLVAVTEVDFDRDMTEVDVDQAVSAPAGDPAQLLADALRQAHGDPLDITAGSCGSISDSDLRYYCNGSCGSISDSENARNMSFPMSFLWRRASAAVVDHFKRWTTPRKDQEL